MLATISPVSLGIVMVADDDFCFLISWERPFYQDDRGQIDSSQSSLHR